MAGLADLFGLSGGGMFGQNPMSQMFAGAVSSPQAMQMMRQLFTRPQSGGFMPGIEGEGLSPDPYAATIPDGQSQYTPSPGQVPLTYDQNIFRDGMLPGTMDNMLQGMPPPQNPGVPGAYGGLPPEILRMLLAPRQT